MADTQAPQRKLSPEYMEEIESRIKRLLQDICNDVYELGFANGAGDTLARIMKAAQPNAPKLPTFSLGKIGPDSKSDTLPGASTHRLIESVLRALPSGKATPTEIAASPQNTSKIKRDAVRNAMRRGKKTGRYVSDGKGRYSLGAVNG